MNYIQKLLGGEKVEWKTLGEVCKINKGKQLNKTELRDEGEYPAYNGGKSYSGFTNNYNVEANTIIVSQGGASAGFVNFITTKFWANAHCYYLLPNLEVVDNRYLYHFMKSNERYFMEVQHGAGIPALATNKLANHKIPIPPLPVQQKIAEILDNFCELEKELEKELLLRKKQYEYYRDKLLSFNEIRGGYNRLIFNNLQWKTLEEVAKKISSGGTPKTGVSEYYDGEIPWLRTQEVGYGDIWDTEIKITEKGLNNSSAKWIPENCVIIAMYGATVGRVGINKIPLTTNQACANIQIDENIANYKYVYYCLLNQYEYIKSLGTGSQTNINAQIVRKLKIPIPPMEEQERIVKILDKFDILVNSISEGLPKEIALRRKQYEYYREQLLSFRE